MALINCTECNAQISDKAKNCPKCGAPIVIKETIKCFECETELEKGTKVCSNCGAEQEVKQEVEKEIKKESKKEEATNMVVLPAQPKKKNKGLMWTLISVGALVLIVIIALSINNQNNGHSSPPFNKGNSPSNSGNTYSTPEPPREKTPEELRQELLDKERQTPMSYLTAIIKIDVKVPLFKKTEYIANVTVSNSATMATFKDVVLNIQFLATTDALLGTIPYTLNDYISPKSSKSFQKKVVLPSGTKKSAVKIISCKW